MKCLTVCQPHAWFIFADVDKLAQYGIPPKRIENRNWETRYRGPLLIHAGASTKWMAGWWDSNLPPLVYGAILGACELEGCWPNHAESPNWITEHYHTDGTSAFWWAIGNVRRFAEPIPYKGAQGLFNVPDSIVSKAMAALTPAC